MSKLRQAAEMALGALETIKSSCREGRTAHAENEVAIVECLLRQALDKPEIEPQALVEMAVLAEREACAKLCLEEAPSLDGQLCAEAIRARGVK